MTVWTRAECGQALPGRTAYGYATWLAHGGRSIIEEKDAHALATAIPTKRNSLVISITQKATKCRNGFENIAKIRRLPS